MAQKTPPVIVLPAPATAPPAPRWTPPPTGHSGIAKTPAEPGSNAFQTSKDITGIEDADHTDTSSIPQPAQPAQPAQPTGPAQPPAPPDAASTPTVRSPEALETPVTAYSPARIPPALPSVKPGRIRRVLGLDGLRGIAVLTVVIYHFFDGALPGGFLGVDIFFVLSGFLITSLLIREVGATGRVSLTEFWRRRARRILPASIAVLVITTAVAGLIGGDVQVGLVPQFLGSLFFTNNWVQIAQSHSYFADTTPQLFMHYWSLAIEEQFYVLWPLLFLGLLWLGPHLHRTSGALNNPSTTATAASIESTDSADSAGAASPRDRRFRLITAVATILGIASLLAMLMLYHPDTDPSRVYFGTDTHAFGLLAGAVLALIVTTASPTALDSWPALRPTTPPNAASSATPDFSLAPPHPSSRHSRLTAAGAWILGSAALLGLTAMLWLLPDTSPVTYRGGLLGASLLSVILIMTTLRDAGPVAWLLRLRPLRYLGERSFSLYLWHWSVVVFLRDQIDTPGSDTPGWVVGTLALIISLLLAEASYRWVENPLRRKGYHRTLQAMASTKMLVVPVTILVITLLAGVALGSSPAKSELERHLDELTERQNSAPPPPTAAPPIGLPKGSEITGIGDSVMLAASPALQARFPGITIDAAVSRHYSGGEPPIQAMIDNNTMRKYVVLGFGTNGRAFDGELDKIREMLGPNRMMILVVPFGYTDGIQDAADQVIDYAATTPNVYLAPWCQLALTHPGDLVGDGVHPDEQGQQRYTDAVATGLRQAASGQRDSSINCPM